MRKAILIGAILLGVISLAAVILFVGAAFYLTSSSDTPTRRVTSAWGLSADIPQGVYVCHSDNGLSVVIRGPAPEDVTLCQGPEPDEMVRTYEGFRLFAVNDLVLEVPESECEAYLKSGTIRRNSRRITYTICSKGGGSGGLEYELYATTNHKGHPIAAFAYTQVEMTTPKFDYVFDALASAEVARP